MTTPFIPPEPSTFTPPIQTDFNAQMGVGSDVDRQEWELRKQRINELINNLKQRQDLASMLGQGAYQGYPHRATETADQLVNRTIAPPDTEHFDFQKQNELFGAAQYYNIAGYDKIPLPQLQQIVNAARLGQQKTHTGDLPFGQGVEAAGAALEEGATHAFFGTTESLYGLAQKVPFLKDVLAERADYDKMNQRLARFNESVRASMSPEQAARYNTVTGVGDAIGQSVIAWPLWELAGATGKLPMLAKYGARMDPIARAAIQGSTVAAVMKEGGPGTEEQRGNEVASGGAFAAGLTALAPALGWMVQKLKGSFPTKAVGTDLAPQTVDADWSFLDDNGPPPPPGAGVVTPPNQPILPAGQAALPAPSGPTLPAGQYNMPRPNSTLELAAASGDVPQGDPATLPQEVLEAFASQHPEEWARQMDAISPQSLAPDDIAGRRALAARRVLIYAQRGSHSIEPPATATADAISLSKQSAIMQSPASMDIAGQTSYDNSDVIRARTASSPASISVVKNIGDPATLMRQMTEPGAPSPAIRMVQREGRLDALVSNRPISDRMASDYEQYGLYEDQLVQHQGKEFVVVEPGPVTSRIAPSYGLGDIHEVPTADLVGGETAAAPMPETVGVKNGASLYERFKKEVLYGFNDEAAAAGIGEKDWLSPEVASVLPRRMAEFFQENGITDPAQRQAMDSFFNKQRVLDYQLSEPETFADLNAALARVMDAWNAPPTAAGFEAEIRNPVNDTGLYQLADTKNFVWQNHPGQASGNLLDLHTGDVYPMDHEGAATDFLKNFSREVPDHTPISDVPAEVGQVSVGGANAGQSTEGTMDTQDIVDNYTGHEDNLEDEAATADFHDATATVPAHPGTVFDPVVSLPPRAPVPPAGSPPLPPDQPPSPPSASGFGPDDPRLRGARPETLGDQFARAQKVQPKHLEDVGNRFDSIIMRFLNPMRSLTMRATPWFEEMGINARNLWADGQALYEGRARSHNEAAPWMTESRDIFNNIRRVFVRNGTVTKVAEIADFNQRMAEMKRLGYTDAEITAQNRLEDFNNRFFQQQMVGEMGFNPHQRIFGYMSRVRARQANPRFTGDAYADTEGHLGPFDWFAEHARTGELDFREMNAERLTDHMIRAAMFEKHLAPTWNAMRTAWSDQRIPSKISDVVLNWLDVVRGGYNPKYQLGIHGVRQTLNSFGIPATNRDVQSMWNFVFKNFYRSGLGFKPAAFFRDSIQPLFAWTRYGNFGEMAGVYGDVMTNPAARAEMLERGYKGGWIERGRVRAGVSEAFDPVRNTEGVDLTNNQLRENANKVMDYIHDRLPDRFKGGIQGTYADPMYIYGQKLGTLNRLVTGETGWRVATKAIAEYRAGRLSMADLMEQSSARQLGTGKFFSTAESTGPIKQQFQRLVAQGHDAEAANLVAHEWADTQFRGGIAENPMGIRSLAGRAASMYGNFTVGYINQMKEGFSAGTVSDRVKFGMRQAMIAYAIGEAEKRSKWKGFSNWQWYSSLAFAGGPLATGALAFNQLVSGGLTRLMGNQPNPQQSDALRGSLGPDSPRQNPNNTFPMSINPYRGAVETVEGLSGAASGASPAEDAARFLLTNDRRGQGGGPALQRWWESLPEIAPNRPQLDPAFGRPMALNASASLVAPSTVPQTGLNVPDSTSGESGARPGETYDQYRRRVLSRTTWSPDTAAHRNLRALRPEIREPLTAMIKAAADEGVQLDVSETGRSQERQEYLFQQGRSRPGPQVTWTLNSDHAHGRAADLVSPTAQGYVWIQRNAARFGLHTLGASDPGHVYVPNDSQVSGGIKSFIDSVLRAPTGSAEPGGGAHQ